MVGMGNGEADFRFPMRSGWGGRGWTASPNPHSRLPIPTGRVVWGGPGAASLPPRILLEKIRIDGKLARPVEILERAIAAIDREGPGHSSTNVWVGSVRQNAAPDVRIRRVRRVAIARVARLAEEQKPAVRHLHGAGKTGPAHTAMPARVQAPGEETRRVHGAQHTVRGAPRRVEQPLIARVAESLENAAHRIANGMRERLYVVSQTAALEPTVGALLAQCPLDVRERRVGVARAGIDAVRLEQPPCHVRRIRLLTG